MAVAVANRNVIESVPITTFTNSSTCPIPIQQSKVIDSKFYLTGIYKGEETILLHCQRGRIKVF